jgi:hypothetical protein
LILHDFRTLKKTTGVAPQFTPILDLPSSPGYCANETLVAFQPHPAATPAFALVHTKQLESDISTVPA